MIEFLAPVESMRGNLSGKQELLYPTKDNSAWDAPSGQRSYARNYKARYIGNKRSSTLKTYFSVKRKQAVYQSEDSKFNQALLGATQAVYAAIRNSPERMPGTNYLIWDYLQMIYRQKREYGELDARTTPRMYITDTIRTALELKTTAIGFQAPSLTNLVVYNPWNHTSTVTGAVTVNVSTSTLVKFWTQLRPYGMYFYVRNEIGISYTSTSDPDTSSLDFSEITGTESVVPNVLALTHQTIGSSDYIKYGTYFLLKSDGTYVTEAYSPAVNEKFKLTSIAPTA
jgi:hypothetical protein